MSETKPATDEEVEEWRDLAENGWPLADYNALPLLARLDAERARAEAAEAKLAKAREVLSEVVAWADDLRLFSERGSELAPVFQKAKAALDDTGGGEG